jgi:serine/threonine protein kinase
MGEVYRARDTRLERSVAMKILPSEFCADALYKQRFEREAKAISRDLGLRPCAQRARTGEFQRADRVRGRLVARRARIQARRSAGIIFIF